MFENLRQRAEQYIADHKAELDKLAEHGITKRALSENTKDSQIVVTYPPTSVIKQSPPTYDLYQGVNPDPDKREKAVLYVHIPFCEDICTYCAYARSRPTGSEESVEAKLSEYLDHLETEAKLHREKLGGSKVPVESVYIGGGTPTILTEGQLKRLYKIIGDNFQLAKEGEYTLEGNPSTITEQKVKDAVQNGVNRVSFGAESFVDEMLIGVNRQHGKEGIFAALDNIRKGGIQDIDIDMIRGLVGFRKESAPGPDGKKAGYAIAYDDNMLLEDLRSIQKSGIPSITSYQYTVKPGSTNYTKFAYAGKTSATAKTIAAADQQLLDDYKQYVSGGEALVHHVMFKLGMEEIGYNHADPTIDWFTLKGSGYYKHNYQKWGQSYNLIGLGQGSYGYVEGHQYINHGKTQDYYKAIDQGRLPVFKAMDISPDEQMRRRFLFGLKSEVDVERFKQKHGVDPIDTSFGGTLKEMMEIGAITKTAKGNYRLADIAQYTADWVMMKFYSPSIAQEMSASNALPDKK